MDDTMHRMQCDTTRICTSPPFPLFAEVGHTCKSIVMGMRLVLKDANVSLVS